MWEAQDVVTSRTGTATYLRNRRRVLRHARSEGLTHCPGYERRDGTHRACGRELNYDAPLLDGSAETDHIVDYQFGGTDEAENLRVLCRACNRERSHERVLVAVPSADDFPLSQDWT
jgi:5-methylcytosine-specific restriction endonuclease McrA